MNEAGKIFTDVLRVEVNPFSVRLADIPVLDYPAFRDKVKEMTADEGCHCVTYHAVPLGKMLKLFCVIASDKDHCLYVFSHEQNSAFVSLEPLTLIHPSFYMYEREISEQFGVEFPGHPWLKPVRTQHPASSIRYPFFSIDGEGVHEVGVGPIHAGVIEPGYFRFSCHGEKVLHLEIMLGYQQRGVERLFTEKSSGVQRAVLSESIAGDTAVAHALAHAQLMEALGGYEPAQSLQAHRIIALELERIAVHIGDTAALCTDIAYQFGQSACEALRTVVINTTQAWCGNRFGKGLVRTGGSRYQLTPDLVQLILANLREVEERYAMITRELFSNPSVLSRFEGIGKLTARQAGMIGAVGMAARSSGLKRDLRWSHPFQSFRTLSFEPLTFHQGDVWARAMLRKTEVERSAGLIRELLNAAFVNEEITPPLYDMKLQASGFALSLVEGWRGEIMQSAVTGENGNIIHYKVKDPSFHNWMALALAVREQEISDFPLCNKSYNLSYCGHDL